MRKTTRPGDYLGILRILTTDGCPYFLEGGQAVNFWAEYFTLRDHGLKTLAPFQPFTSKDCDLWVSLAALQHFERNPDGKLVKGASPADGQLAVFTTRGTPPLKIDLMSGVFGVPAGDMDRLQQRAIEIGGVKILDPLFLFKGKCHNLVKLPQGNRQDRKHVMMLGLIIPIYFEELIGETQGGRLDERQVIREIKLLLQMGRDGWVRQALKKVGLSLVDMIPITLLRSCGLPKIERFACSAWRPNGNTH